MMPALFVRFLRFILLYDFHQICYIIRISLNIGGSVGDENYTMCGPSFSPNFYFMWPGAR
jgi:hypothetical protein